MRAVSTLALFSLVLAAVFASRAAGQDPPVPKPDPPKVDTTKVDTPAGETPEKPKTADGEAVPKGDGDTAAADPAKPAAAPKRPLQVGEALTDDIVLTAVRTPSDETPAPSPEPVRALAGEPKRPFVLLFWSRSCPVSRRYHTPFAALAKDFGAQASFVIVITNYGEVPAEARQALTDASIALPVLADSEQATALRLGIRVTPTALVFDAGGVLRYRGPVDDDRRAKNREPVQHLRDALAAVTSGRQVEGPEPRPFGCALRRKPKKTD